MQTDSSNELFFQADRLVNHTSRNIFLTGKAGTGKTTFLRHIKENCAKNMAVVAPTGVAAINAGGVTIHSFFQLPFSPFIPDSRWHGRSGEALGAHGLMSRLKLNGQKKQVLQQLELLIIDEISMVRCDVLDAIDTVLRHVRHRHRERFGGVQVLFIGDMYQLAPVAKEQEWNLLSEYYKSPYFFHSKVMEDEQPVYIEFKHIYRQTEENFINMLNQVRNNELDEVGLDLLNQRYLPDFTFQNQEGYIVLTTHNEKARQINNQKLEQIKGPAFVFQAEIKDDFYESSYPADPELQLKAGAQVMFIRNDTEKKYYNGKIGIVKSVSEEGIVVSGTDGEDDIRVKKETWENIRYKIDQSTRKLEEDVLGSFTQYPLRLAWAITIHKSQGLTFSKAVIDAGQAFSPGQVYVALSRCSSLEGLVLKSRIRPGTLYTDPRIVEFSKNQVSASELDKEINLASRSHYLKTLASVFDFNLLIKQAMDLGIYIREQSSSFHQGADAWCGGLLDFVSTLEGTAVKFRNQLREIFEKHDGRPEENDHLQQRVQAAMNYFKEKLDDLDVRIRSCNVVTDSRTHAREVNEQLKQIFLQTLMQKHICINKEGVFRVENFYNNKRSFRAHDFSINVYAAVSSERVHVAHKELYRLLKDERDRICEQKDLPVYMVAGSKALEEMTAQLPRTKEDFLKIKGFGTVRFQQYGKNFMDIIKTYCEENNIEDQPVVIQTKRSKPSKPGSSKTKLQSLDLYKKGMSVPEIAEQRNLALSTIEYHLSSFVASGDLPVTEFVDDEKLKLIEPLLVRNDNKISPVREVLGEQVSYNEIRYVQAWLQRQNKSAAHKNHQDLNVAGIDS